MTSAAEAANTTFSGWRRRPRCAPDQVERDQVGPRADVERPGVGPAQRARARRRWRRSAVGRARTTPRSARAQPLVELDRPGLLEEVDHGVAVAAQAERTAGRRSARGAGPIPSPRSRSVVGQKHTPVALSRRSATSASVRWVACTAVVRGPSTPCSRSSAVGVQPCTARHWSSSAGCSLEWTCSGASQASAHAATVGQLVGGHRAHGMHCGADQHVVVVLAVRAQCVDPLRPAVGVAVAEAPLRSLAAARRPTLGGQVTGVQQGEPDARRRRGGDDQRLRPSRWVGVRRRRPGRGAGSGTRRPR